MIKVCETYRAQSATRDTLACRDSPAPMNQVCSIVVLWAQHTLRGRCH